MATLITAKILLALFVMGNVYVEYRNHVAKTRPFRDSMISFYFAGKEHQVQDIAFGLLAIALVLLGTLYTGSIQLLFFLSALTTVVLTVTWKMLPNMLVHAIAAGITFLSLAYVEWQLLEGATRIPLLLGFVGTLLYLVRKENAMAEKAFAIGLSAGLLLL